MRYQIETQFTVHIPNAPGKIAELSHLLSECNVSMSSVSVSDGPTNGLFRFTTSQSAQATECLLASGLRVTTEDVITIRLQDSKGRLARLASLLSAAGVNIDYMYATVDEEGGGSRLVLRVSNIPLATHILKETLDAA